MRRYIAFWPRRNSRHRHRPGPCPTHYFLAWSRHAPRVENRLASFCCGRSFQAKFLSDISWHPILLIESSDYKLSGCIAPVAPIFGHITPTSSLSPSIMRLFFMFVPASQVVAKTAHPTLEAKFLNPLKKHLLSLKAVLRPRSSLLCLPENAAVFKLFRAFPFVFLRGTPPFLQIETVSIRLQRFRICSLLS